MKKIGVFLITFLLPFMVSAQEYEIKDQDLKLSLDDDWYVFTIDNIEGNKDLEDFEVSEEYVKEFFETNNIYVDAISKKYDIEFFVTVVKNPQINNLSNYPDKYLKNDLKKDLRQVINDVGADISFDKINDVKYLIASFFDKTIGVYIYRYYTIVNAKDYSFQIQKSTAFTKEEKEALKKIVETANVKVNILYKNETSENQKKIDEYNKSSKNSMIRIAIYVIAGIAACAVGYVTRNRQNKKNEENMNNL